MWFFVSSSVWTPSSLLILAALSVCRHTKFTACYVFLSYFLVALQPKSGSDRLIFEGSASHTRLVGFLFTDDQLVAEAATYTIHTRNMPSPIEWPQTYAWVRSAYLRIDKLNNFAICQHEGGWYCWPKQDDVINTYSKIFVQGDIYFLFLLSW